MKTRAFIALTLIALMTACKKDEDQPEETYTRHPLSLEIPANLPIMDIPDDNPLTLEGVRLGRMLYYDSLLHPTKMHACASCHLQPAGFTTPGTNIIPHINLGYSSKFLWNGEVQGTLEDAMMFEVEEFFGTDVSKLQAHPLYPRLFFEAFGGYTVTTEHCAMALAQFQRTLISGNSKFDKFMRHEVNLTTQEMMGFTIFNTEKGDCFHCHSLSLMTDGNLHNIGLDSVFTGLNEGYYTVSGDPGDLGKFKSPSLRNVALRTSFMHDGRFTTLDEVINHYNNEVKITPSVDPIMTKPGKENGLELTPFDIDNLKAFLHTLTDSTYLTNPQFSSPF
jgi:cytochrome c peroxidase